MKHLSKLVFAVFWGGLFIWVLKSVDLYALGETFAGGDYRYLLPTFPILVIIMIVRACRWRMLLPDASQAPISSLYTGIVVGYLANNVLPARGGDLVRVYYLGNRENISKSLVLSTLVLERVIDLICACLLLGLAGLLFVMPDWLRDGGIFIGTGALVGLVVLIGVEAFGRRFTDHLLALIPFMPDWLLLRLRLVLEGFLQGVTEIRKLHKAVGFLCFTLLLWSMEIGIAWIVSCAFHLDLSFSQAWIVMLFAVFASLVPALPGQFGAFEFAVVTGLVALGMSEDIGLAYALGWHAILLIVTSGLGGLALVYSGLSLAQLRRVAKSEKAG